MLSTVNKGWADLEGNYEAYAHQTLPIPVLFRNLEYEGKKRWQINNRQTINS